MPDQLTDQPSDGSPPAVTPTTEHRSGRPRPALLGAAAQGLLIVVAFAAAGIVCGFVWESVWSPPHMVVQQHQVYYVDDAAVRGVFSGTGTYVIVAVLGALLTSAVVCLLARRREILTFVAVVIGSVVAAVLMARTGVARGPVDPRSLAPTAANGTRVLGDLRVSGTSPYVVWPMASLIPLVFLFFTLPGKPSSRRAAE